MRKKSLWKRPAAVLLSLAVTAGMLTGCGAGSSSIEGGGDTAGASEEKSGEKVFYYGDTTFNAENDESDVNPHNGYAGWACIRYGVGETLFKYSDSMELEPWLAEKYENVDKNTWVITLKEGITFTSGRGVDGQAVKECLEHLTQVHERAKGDLKIQEIIADGQTVTIKTQKPVPAFMNYLSDPYGCIIDMEAGITPEGNVSGTGPYQAGEVLTYQGLTLVKNEDYWDGTPKLDTIHVQTITDGDTMTMSMQSGELDAAYGLPYASLPLFEQEPYSISSVETSRSFFATINYETEALQDENIRQTQSSAKNKENITPVLIV